MFNTIKSSFKLTTKYINLATPLILYFLISSLYILFIANGKIIGLIIALILLILMLTAFCSGWFSMIKNVVQNNIEDDINSIFKHFMPGVGEYFLSNLGGILFALTLFLIILASSYFIGLKAFGEINITQTALVEAMKTPETLKTFLLSLSKEQLQQLMNWNLLILLSNSIFTFILMFYFPAIFFKSKNIFKSFYCALKDLFSHKFLQNLGLYLIILITYMALQIFTSILNQNIFLHFLLTIINFYYLVFITVLIFNYYYKNFVQIGGNLDTQI